MYSEHLIGFRNPASVVSEGDPNRKRGERKYVEDGITSVTAAALLSSSSLTLIPRSAPGATRGGDARPGRIWGRGWPPLGHTDYERGSYRVSTEAHAPP